MCSARGSKSAAALTSNGRCNQARHRLASGVRRPLQLRPRHQQTRKGDSNAVNGNRGRIAVHRTSAHACIHVTASQQSLKASHDARCVRRCCSVIPCFVHHTKPASSIRARSATRFCNYGPHAQMLLATMPHTACSPSCPFHPSHLQSCMHTGPRAALSRLQPLHPLPHPPHPLLMMVHRA